MPSKITEDQYRQIILDLRSYARIGLDFDIAASYVRQIKLGVVLRDYRDNLDEYSRLALDWQFRMERFVKGRLKMTKTENPDIFIQQFKDENPFPEKDKCIKEFR